MDESYLLATVRYVELNPVKAKIAASHKIGYGRVRQHIWQVVMTS